MEVLLTILILVMTAQSFVFIYANFVDINKKRAERAMAEAAKESQQSYVHAIESYNKATEAKDETIRQWIRKYNHTAAQLDETRKAYLLLKNRTAAIEGIKDSFNQIAETMWDDRGYIEPGGNAERLRFVEGVKAGAEWLADCVGVKVEFEIDDRHKQED